MGVLVTLLAMGLSTAATVGNNWFTYGLWPRSWGAFLGFLLVQVVLSIIIVAARELD